MQIRVEPRDGGQGCVCETMKRLSPPWFVIGYLCTFFLLHEIDWKLGVAWLLWRISHALAFEWMKEWRERKANENDEEKEHEDGSNPQ